MTSEIPIPEGHIPNRSISSLCDEYFELCNRVPQISAERVRAKVEALRNSVSKEPEENDSK